MNFVRALHNHTRKQFAFYEPHNKQLEFHRLGTECRERLFLAGNRTGKTYCGAMEMAMHLTGVYPDWWPGHRFDYPIDAWAASNTTESTRDILQRTYIGDPVSGVEGLIHSDCIERMTSRRGVADAIDTVYVKHISGGISRVGFKSYDQGRSKFQGTHKDFIHFDEEPPLDVYSEALLRLMGVGKKPSGHMMMTMTPLSGMTNLVMLYSGGGGAPSGVVNSGRVYVQAGWNDNPYLSEAEKAEYRMKTPPHELEAREKGVPSLGAGRVYPIQESLILCEPFEIPDHFAHVYGMDFGWTAPTAVIFGAHDRQNDIVYLYGEYYQPELSPQQHVNNLQSRGIMWMRGVCDPAGQGTSQLDGKKIIDLYYNSGLKLSIADNSKESGVMTMLQRMQTGRLKVFSNLNKWLSEFRVYARDEKTGLIKKGNDHLMDATRYLIVSGLGIAKSKRELQPNILSRQRTDSGWAV